MKIIFSQDIGGDGGKASLGVDQDQLILQASYPLQKILDPAEKALDGALDALALKIPGSWDDAIIAQFKADYKAKLLALISEQPA